MNLKTACLALFACCLTGCAGQAGLLGFGMLSAQDRNDYRHARDLFHDGHYQEAVADLSNYIYKTRNVRRREVRAYRLLGQSYEHLGNLSRALETYLEALEFHPKDVPLLLAAATLYNRTGLTDRAIELYERALQLDPSNQNVLAGLGEVYVKTGFYSKARGYYEKLFALYPQAAAVHRARYAASFYQQKDFANAFIHITLALEQEPENADFWLLSAKAQRGFNRLSEALKDLDTALLLAPGREDLQAYRALWLHQAGQYEESDKTARYILAHYPANELALFVLAMNASARGQHGKANHYLTQIRTDGEDSFIHRFAQALQTPPAKTAH